MAIVNKVKTKTTTKIFSPIENYIYLYHTNTLLLLPNYPTNINDSTSASFQKTDVLGRSAPIYSYENSGPRSMQINLDLHRESLNQVNFNNSWSGALGVDEDYVDLLIKQIQAAVLPNYAESQKMVDPPLAAIKFANDIFCKGVIDNVGVEYKPPILKTNKFAFVSISFKIEEVDPYDADMVMQVGSYRNSGDILLDTSLEKDVYNAVASGRNSGLMRSRYGNH